jgi:hypothetical protein
VQYDESDFNGNDIAEIWRSAQRRRSSDVYALFANLSRARPHIKPFGFRIQRPLGYARSLIWKLLAATGTVPRTTN